MWIDRLSFYMENMYQAYSTQYCFAEVGMMINSWFIKKIIIKKKKVGEKRRETKKKKIKASLKHFIPGVF